MSLSEWLEERKRKTKEDEDKRKELEKQMEEEKLKKENDAKLLQQKESVKGEQHKETDGIIQEENDSRPAGFPGVLREKELEVQQQEREDSSVVSTVVQKDTNRPTMPETLPTESDAARRESSSTATGTKATAVTTTVAQSPELVDSKQTETQNESETDTDNSTVNPGNATQQSSPAAVSTAPSDGNPSNQTIAERSVTAADSEETNSTTPPSSESTTTEASTTTPSPVPVPNAVINTIPPNMLTKANVDSSISPVWMRTVAPLLIVVTLACILVC
ncbi:uncharacterized protein TM35_000531340 [Trypanosoma theileri]|uniref:Uncharacterized protein n=1 Tax=Trypanosoma theileri TaxID=67003 RepID=A0A1X0NIL7_9TRYP|nr:uncharacterized protein TM35_000531340 [Trypanosoma theileri]ORC83950.1 hypothetical protein TM35_000531340 [Trypanosoma theileri]